MKYDCTLALDYAHERNRMCKTMNDKCEKCPFWNFNCDDITKNQINVLQMWSDEHPERPKLTREEYDFLQAFRATADKHLERKNGHLCFMMGYTNMELWPMMFSFIKEGETWFLGDLLKLEVEE